MMSFVIHDYPGLSGQCAMCGKFDCSKDGEPWFHLTTMEDTPSIGKSCVVSMAENAGLMKPDEVVHEVMRPPSDEEIGHYVVNQLLGERIKEVSKSLADGLRNEFREANHDDSPVSEPDSKRGSGSRNRSGSNRSSKGTKGTD